MARHYLLHDCQIVACIITKRTQICDQRLFRIVSYIHQNIDISMFGWVGDKSADWRVWLHTDTDFAADKSTSKSVSGVFCAICGPKPFSPLCALTKNKVPQATLQLNQKW